MAAFHHHLHFLLLAVLAFTVTVASGSSPPAPSSTVVQPPSPSALVRSACAGARFPDLCIRTVAPHSPTSITDVARIATSASLSATSSAADFLRHLPPPSASGDRAVINECANLLLDAADQLTRAVNQLAHLRPTAAAKQLARLRHAAAANPSQVDDAQTWASAAMTDQDMCARDVDGLAQPTREAVLRRVTEASQCTSNALYLIARLASSGGRNR